MPIDEWFDIGLTPAEAATRCLDWRRIATVLPADEVMPGEADLPAGLLQSPAREDHLAGEAEQPEQPVEEEQSEAAE